VAGGHPRESLPDKSGIRFWRKTGGKKKLKPV
jgi:hypothetical protein